MAWLDTQQIGALTMKMSSDRQPVARQTLNAFKVADKFCMWRAFYISSWKMTLVMLITVPMLLAALIVSGKVFFHFNNYIRMSLS
ncbi:hypothetical protein KIN20_001008 [Parelaphostrongylus tenuis]|uniref:Uncharacterized protein n=1 Tax=Parelaphostrongylus tenuis TaxID=148309 RepID=A0AAD5QFZ1_PARTN|nr:hypothetical protein KIN20_001008 [Parelaphostrongylus tenuis]